MDREDDAEDRISGSGAGAPESPERPEKAGAAPVKPDAVQLFDDFVKSVEAELFPAGGDPGPPDSRSAPAGCGEPPASSVLPEEEEETALLPSESEEEEPAPFASADAPWVGAERKWLRGSDQEPAGREEPPGGGETASAEGLADPDEEDVALPVPGQIPVLPSLIPPSRTGSSIRFEIVAVVTLLLVVAAAIGIVWWMDQSFTEREQEILAQREFDKREVARLEREIRELLARGGVENEARAEELRVELQARQEAAGQVAGPPVADPSVAGAEQEQCDESRGRRSGRDPEGAKDGVEVPSEDAPVPLDDYPDDAPVPPAATAEGPGASKPEVDDLLGAAFSRPAEAPAPAPAPSPTQGATGFPVGAARPPESPSREQVRTTMDAVAPLVAKCSPGGGRIVMSVTVAGATGRVVDAEATGDAAGTQLGRCAARAVKLAKFPPFSRERLQIKYPFDL